MQKAKKKFLYFLDNDSIINLPSLKAAQETLNQAEGIDFLCGPSILNEKATFFERNSEAVLSSPAVVGKISSRYSRKGELRKTNEFEVILCNLIIHKTKFEEIGGFNAKLYPNEENDLVNKALKQNQGVYYSPNFYVEKPHRKDLKEFFNQMVGYGVGRAEQIKVNHPKWFPNRFKFFLIFFILAFAMMVWGNWPIFFSAIKNIAFLYTVYLALVFVKTSSKKKEFLFYTPLITALCHVVYSFSILIGLTKKKFNSDKKKKFYKVKIFH